VGRGDDAVCAGPCPARFIMTGMRLRKAEVIERLR
jgi:hypothetical protein